MVKSNNVSPNGIKVERWMKGTIHEVNKEFAGILIAAKMAVKEINPVKPTEEKKEVKQKKEKDKKGK